ncbi:hypothetical protein T01_11845 [Trichinella spiralis]|uniref:Uncharacterized protein n=1 Tax=Trichinella spiralis TaxID=6334 RepID=A0A0V1AM02_TRISP|nr:hypothetical protein T01_11845 [Trichinella spiralis]
MSMTSGSQSVGRDPPVNQLRPTDHFENYRTSPDANNGKLPLILGTALDFQRANSAKLSKNSEMCASKSAESTSYGKKS